MEHIYCTDGDGKKVNSVIDNYFNGNLWNENNFSSKTDERLCKEQIARDELLEKIEEQ